MSVVLLYLLVGFALSFLGAAVSRADVIDVWVEFLAVLLWPVVVLLAATAAVRDVLAKCRRSKNATNV